MDNFIGILVIVLVLAGIGILAYLGFKKNAKKEVTGKVTTPSPKIIKIDDVKTKKNINL